MLLSRVRRQLTKECLINGTKEGRTPLEGQQSHFSWRSIQLTHIFIIKTTISTWLVEPATQHCAMAAVPPTASLCSPGVYTQGVACTTRQVSTNKPWEPAWVSHVSSSDPPCGLPSTPPSPGARPHSFQLTSPTTLQHLRDLRKVEL